MRLETGPLQVGDDWSGLFIRGDACVGNFLALKTFLEDPTNIIARMQVEELLHLLQLPIQNLDKQVDPMVFHDLRTCVAQLPKALEARARFQIKCANDPDSPK